MHVLVLGHGAVGRVLAKLLDKEKGIRAISVGDISFKKEEKFGKRHHLNVNIMDEQQLINLFKSKKPDVVVNATHPKFNLHIMKACAKAKVNYIDTASFWDLDPNPKAKIPYIMEQMEYDEEFRKNNLIGLIESGVAPGFDNLMAAQAASELDEVDYIKIRMVEDTGSSEIFFSWNKEWLLDELASPPMIYENGKFKLMGSFGAEEEYEFPKPIGKKKTYYFAQDEVGSIPLYIKTKKLDVKIHDNNIDVSKLLVVLGLLSQKELDVKGMKIKPFDVLSKLLPDPIPGEEKRFPKARFAMAVEAIGKLNGKKKTVKYSVVFPNQEEIGKMKLDANFISYPTALSVKLFTMVIGKIARRGVFPPEALDASIREEIFKELKKAKGVKLIRESW